MSDHDYGVFMNERQAASFNRGLNILGEHGVHSPAFICEIIVGIFGMSTIMERHEFVRAANRYMRGCGYWFNPPEHPDDIRPWRIAGELINWGQRFKMMELAPSEGQHPRYRLISSAPTYKFTGKGNFLSSRKVAHFTYEDLSEIEDNKRADKARKLAGVSPDTRRILRALDRDAPRQVASIVNMAGGAMVPRFLISIGGLPELYATQSMDSCPQVLARWHDGRGWTYGQAYDWYLALSKIWFETKRGEIVSPPVIIPDEDLAALGELA